MAEFFTAEFNRRGWLKMAGLATSGLIASQRIVAKPADGSASPAVDKQLVRLSLNENPFGPAPSVAPAIERELANLSRYTGAAFGELLSLIAAKEGVPRDQIILGEILEPLGNYLGLQGGPGGEFIYSDPGYTALIDAATALGGVGIPVPLDRRMQNDLNAIGTRVGQRTRALFLVNPHNPTGTVSDAGELRRFVRSVSARALVIVDEAYLEFATAYSSRTLADLVRTGENVIVFRTFAKAYGLAGLDIGYGLVPKRIAQALDKQGLNNPHLFNRLAVSAALASLEDPSYIADVVAKVSHERQIWFELFQELKVPATASSGNFVFFETGMPHVEFAEALLKESIDIGRAFPPYDRWARISIGLPQENARAHAAVRAILTDRR
jgi:histidinol-phosphate aminotransferase